MNPSARPKAIHSLTLQPWLPLLAIVVAVLLAGLLGSGCEEGPVLAPAAPPGLAPLPADFPLMPTPADNPLTESTVALGRALFFDPILSRTREISCSSCHLQERGFADPRQVSEGVEGRRGTRNAPALVNLAWVTSFFWDGGVDTLERQALAPIKDPSEMDLPIDEAVARVAAQPKYVDAFAAAFAEPVTASGLTRALASYVRSLVSGDSRWDRHRRGDVAALTESEKRGEQAFFGEKAGCFHCHDGIFLSNNRFSNNGRGQGSDVGRARVTMRASDRGRFRVPSLRNVAVTAPYMHDGSLGTLEEVVEHYARGGHPAGVPIPPDDNTDPLIRPLPLTPQDQADLVAFLRALTDDNFLRDPRHRPR